MKLNLIYDSKCKINTKWWKIKMNTRNLAQISLRNDPINRQMHGFSFRVSEDKVWSSWWEFSFLFRLNYEFKDSMGAEMSQEYRETNGAWNDEVHKENLIEIQGRILPSRRTVFKEADLGSAVGWRGRSRLHIFSRIVVAAWWSSDHWRTVVMRPHRAKKEMRRFDRPLDLHQAIKVSPRVANSFVERFT